MVQGRIVRPLRMAGHPSTLQPIQEQQQQQQLLQQKSLPRQSSRRQLDDRRRRSLDAHLEEKGGHHRYGTSKMSRGGTSKMSTSKMSRFSRMTAMFRRAVPKFHRTTDDFNVDYMESQRHHHRRRPGEHQLSPQESRRPFQIPSHATLSQRADLWVITAVTSSVSLASFAQLMVSSKDVISTTNRQFAFATSILSSLIAAVLGFAFRYAPLRHKMTRCITSSPPQRPNAYSSPIVVGIKQAISQSYISIELLLVSILSLFWIISIPIIMDGFYTIGQDPLAVFGMEIWNANLFYFSWISVILVGYIFVELITSTDRYGTVPSPSKSSPSWKENTFSKRWMLITLSSIIVMSSSATIYGSNLCSGDVLKSTVYCREALIGIMVGGFVQLLVCCCVGVLYRLRNMNYSPTYDSKGRRRKVNMMKKMSVWKREKYTLFFGMLSLLIQSINVGLLTSPVGGGPGNSSGTLYFASWMTFFLAFEMFLRHLELHTTSVGRKVKRDSVQASASAYMDDTEYSVETYASEEDDVPPEEQSNVMRMLKNGSLGSRSSSGAPVYEEVDSFSAESPRYAIEPQVVYRVQPQKAPSPPPNDTRMIPMKTNDGPKRSQIEPEEERKQNPSPNSSGRDFSVSIRDFSIGSRSSGGDDPSGAREQRALPRYSEVDSASDDISNDKFFEDQVSRAQSFATYDSKEEELDEPRTLPQQYDNLQGSRHSKGPSLSPLKESSIEGRRSSGSLRSKGSSIPSNERSRSGSDRSGSRRSGSRQSRSYQSGSYQSGSRYSSEESQEQELIPPPPPQSYRPVRTPSKSKSRSRSGSRGKSRSGSRGSKSNRSRRSQRNPPVVYTDSDHSSEDSPPPTVSDNGQSQRSNLSGYSERSPATESRSKSTRSGKNKNNNNGPPPPPFLRSEDKPQYYSDYSNPRPVTSVFTREGGPGDESVVSDPTLDACFHNVPVPTRHSKNAAARMPRNRSDPSFDKEKSDLASLSPSYESEQYRRSSSDELPPSEENLSNSGKGSGDEQVDNIVAAALAFAEKTHSLSSYGLQARNSPPATGITAPKSPKKKRRNSGSKSSSNNRRRSKSDTETRASQTSGADASSALESSAVESGASLHSFYSGDPSTGKKSVNDSVESNPTQPSVQDMVTAAIAYAEETRGRGGGGTTPQAKSEKSFGSKKSGAKSVGSMFSDSLEEFSVGDGSEFDC